jgi:signal transduction histidine kinase
MAVAALLVLPGCLWETHPAPRAEHGVLDLRTYAPDVAGPAALDGQWEFYWDRFLTPEDFAVEANAPEPTGYLAFPDSWKGFPVDGKALGGTGQATFRLRLKLWPDARRLTLRLFDIPMAYKLWADGRLVAHSGTVGTDTNTEIPHRSLILAEIKPTGSHMELVLQVSNHHFRAGGVHESIEIAPPGPLETFRALHWNISFAFAGCLLIVAVYHLFLYIQNRKLTAALHFGIYSLFILGYSLTSNTSYWAATHFFQDLPPSVAEYFPIFCYIACGPFLYRFYKSLYPNEIHKAVQYIVDIRLAFFIILLAFAPDYRISQYVALSILTSLLYGIYYIQRLVVCVRRGRKGAGLLLTGSLIFLLTSLNDGLTHAKIINSVYLLEPGMFLLVLFQSLALAKRFTHAIEAEEKLTAELKRKNASLQAEIEERNRLEIEVVNISEEERRSISHELHDGLCQKLTGARLRASILNKRLSGTSDGEAMAKLDEILKASADDAYRTSRGLWPVEHDPSAPGPSLEDLARRIAKDSGVAVHFEKHFHCVECTNPSITMLYRIAQEALTNAVKHAQPKTIHMELRCPAENGVALTVRDDGIGRKATFLGESPGEGLGLSIMAHRAGIIHAALRIEDGPDGGTVVNCVAPCALTQTITLKKTKQTINEL